MVTKEPRNNPITRNPSTYFQARLRFIALSNMINDEEITTLAKLARLDISTEERDAFRQQLQPILAEIEKVQSADTEGVEPTSHVHGTVNVFREDVMRKSMSEEDAFHNAPEKGRGCFVVPLTVDSRGGS